MYLFIKHELLSNDQKYAYVVINFVIIIKTPRYKYQGVQLFYYSPIISEYCSADNKPSNWLSSVTSILTIQAFSYGDSLTNSGLSSNSSFDSKTLPEIGAYNSDTVLTDSTLPKVSPSLISSSTSGNSTKTISPNSFCAYSVIPIVAVLPSILTHSWSLEYSIYFN